MSEKEARAKGKEAASATIVARRATSKENARNYWAKAEKEDTKEAARARVRRKAVAREKDSKATAIHAVSPAIPPEIAGKAKGRDMARQAEREA